MSRNTHRDECRLVTFDIDGTLYNFAPMRLRMAAMVVWHAVISVDLRLILALRRRRKELAEAEREGFEGILVADVAALVGRGCRLHRTQPLVRRSSLGRFDALLRNRGWRALCGTAPQRYSNWRAVGPPRIRQARLSVSRPIVRCPQSIEISASRSLTPSVCRLH
jgi:hypothetical protein